MPVEQIKSAAAQHEDHVPRTYAMRTRHNVIKASLVAGLLLAIVGVSVWSEAGAAETAPATPSLKKAFETRAQVSSALHCRRACRKTNSIGARHEPAY